LAETVRVAVCADRRAATLLALMQEHPVALHFSIFTLRTIAAAIGRSAQNRRKAACGFHPETLHRQRAHTKIILKKILPFQFFNVSLCALENSRETFGV